MTDVVFSGSYFPSVGGDFVFNFATESYLYTGLCPYAYNFKTADWWYVFEGNTTPEGFWIYSFKDEKWYYVLSGYLLEI